MQIRCGACRAPKGCVWGVWGACRAPRGCVWGAYRLHVGLIWGVCGVQVAKEELAALLEAQQDVRRAMQSVQSSRRLDEEQQEQQQQHLADAEAQANKLRMLVHGPQAPAVSPSPCAAHCACASQLFLVLGNLHHCAVLCCANTCCSCLVLFASFVWHLAGLGPAVLCCALLRCAEVCHVTLVLCSAQSKSRCTAFVHASQCPLCDPVYLDHPEMLALATTGKVRQTQAAAGSKPPACEHACPALSSGTAAAASKAARIFCRALFSDKATCSSLTSKCIMLCRPSFLTQPQQLHTWTHWQWWSL